MKQSLLHLALFLGPIASFAQSTPPPAYEFMTVVDVEFWGKGMAKLLFAPAFRGTAQLPLESLPIATAGDQYFSVQQHNLQLVNRYLGEVTATGWELVHVSGGEHKTCYLFRKSKP